MTASPPPAAPPLPAALTAVGVIVYGLVGVLSAIIEVLLIPLHIGAHIFPITVVIAVVVNLALPGLLSVLVDGRWVIAVPLLAWLATAIVLGFANTGGGSILVPGNGADGYVGLALFFVGTLAGFLGVVRFLASNGPHAPRPIGHGPAGPSGSTVAARR